VVNAYAQQYLLYRKETTTSSIRGLRLKIQDRMDTLQLEGRGGSALYADYAQQAQQLEIAETVSATTASFPRPAAAAAADGPKPVRDGILGAIVGLLLGIGLAYLWNALDTRIRGAAEVADRLGLPLLARVPEPPRNLRGQRRLVMLEAPD